MKNSQTTAKPAKTLRQQLEKHEDILKELTTCFDDIAEYKQCVDTLTDYSERLTEGLNDFSDAELQDILCLVQNFQEYSTAWSKELKPFVKLAANP